jgi:hypothetical protein
MKYLKPISILASVFLFFLLMNYEVLLHMSFWKLEIPLGMLMVVLGLFILAVLVLEIWNLAFKKIHANKFNWLFIGYFVLYWLMMIINPFNFPSKPSIKHRGYWEGAGSSGSIVLYNDRIFEIKWVGLVRGGKYVGQWYQKKDTIYLEYQEMILDRVGTKLLYEQDHLIPVDGVSGIFLKGVNFKCF